MSIICELILIGLATMATLALCYIAWLLASGLRTPARLPRELVAYQRAALNKILEEFQNSPEERSPEFTAYLETLETKPAKDWRNPYQA